MLTTIFTLTVVDLSGPFQQRRPLRYFIDEYLFPRPVHDPHRLKHVESEMMGILATVQVQTPHSLHNITQSSPFAHSRIAINNTSITTR